MEGGLAVGRAGKGTPQSPEAESGHTPIDGPLEQAWTPQPPRPLCPAFQPPPPRLGTNSRHLSVSPAAHPHHCGMGSSPAGRRIAAAKSKVPETRRSSVGSRFAPTAILPRGRGLSQPSGRGLSPPRVGTANPVFDDFSFRLTKHPNIRPDRQADQEKSSLPANLFFGATKPPGGGTGDTSHTR